ncbi:hypothetical protein V8E51_015813 [Hyaloscypha variabilis]
MVDILVGPTQKLHRVHKDKLCAKAPYFSTLFNDTTTFPPDSDLIPTVSFPDELPSTFTIFLSWIYENHLPPLKPNKDRSKHHGWTWDVYDVYVLGQTLDLPVLQDLAMDALREAQRNYHQLHALSTIRDVFPRLKDRCAMQRYIGHSLVKAILAADTKKYEELYPTKEIVECLSADERLLGLVVRYLRGMEGRGMKEPRYVVGSLACQYHDHGEKGKCSNMGDGEAGERK